MAEGNGNPKQTGLMLIGMGPGLLASMTNDAITAAESADFRYYEAYTAMWPTEELERLEQRVGQIKKVMRPEIEQPQEILNLAKNSLVAVHLSLVTRYKQQLMLTYSYRPWKKGLNAE